MVAGASGAHPACSDDVVSCFHSRIARGAYLPTGREHFWMAPPTHHSYNRTAGQPLKHQGARSTFAFRSLAGWIAMQPAFLISTGSESPDLYPNLVTLCSAAHRQTHQAPFWGLFSMLSVPRRAAAGSGGLHQLHVVFDGLGTRDAPGASSVTRKAVGPRRPLRL